MSRVARADHWGVTLEDLPPCHREGLFGSDGLMTDVELPFWQWRFEDNPFGSQIVVARDGRGRLVAVMATQISPVWIGERSAGAALLAMHRFHGDFHSPRRRYELSIALTELLIERLRERDVAMLYWYPEPADDRPGQKFLKHDAVRLVNPISVDSAALARLIPGGTARIVSFEEVSSGLDALWQRAHAELGVTIVRSTEYFAWRYAAHPTHQYRFFVIDGADGELEAAAVVHRKPGHDRAEIVDWLVPVEAREVGLRLAGGIAAWAAEAGASRLDAWFCESSPYFQAAQEVGFRLEPGTRLLVARPLMRTLGIEMLRVCWNLVLGDLPER
ncbi:MAG: hypothetical protein RL885_18850 [Planctomycetota bacterium]